MRNHARLFTRAALGAALMLQGTACARANDVPATTSAAPTSPERARLLIGQLAHDSLGGRYTGSAGAMKAAAIIGAEMARLGLEPLGDDGYQQRVPIYAAPAAAGRLDRPTLAVSLAARDSMPRAMHRPAVNVVGMLRGSDSVLRDEFVIVGAHYDHVGTNGAAAVAGDSIFNGADDDASGVVAILEAARQLTEAGAPRRSVIFVAFTGEENGMTGTRWFIAHPPRALAQVVADLQVEMIGRPDSLAGGPGRGWLTGYERSTMGEMLSGAGVPVIADPRPAMNFFSRSDNYPFAQLGIPAHTISSFGGHADYHRVSDEVDTIDFAHMATVVNAVAAAVRVIADGEKPVWKAGGRP